MSDSEIDRSGEKGAHHKVKKSKSSKNNGTFKSEVEIENDMSLLKKCPTLLTVEELTSSDYDAWIVSTPDRVS